MSNSSPSNDNQFESVMQAARAAHAAKAQNAQDMRQMRQEAFASELARLNTPEPGDKRNAASADIEA